MAKNTIEVTAEDETLDRVSDALSFYYKNVDEGEKDSLKQIRTALLKRENVEVEPAKESKDDEENQTTKTGGENQ